RSSSDLQGVAHAAAAWVVVQGKAGGLVTEPAPVRACRWSGLAVRAGPAGPVVSPAREVAPRLRGGGGVYVLLALVLCRTGAAPPSARVRPPPPHGCGRGRTGHTRRNSMQVVQVAGLSCGAVAGGD